MAPIFSNIIELSGAPSGGVGQTHGPGRMQRSSTMIRWLRNLGRISESKKMNFQMAGKRNCAI